MGNLSSKVIEKVAGPSWDGSREKLMDIFNTLLSVSSDTSGELATNYVKCTVTDQVVSPVFAVVWIKTSKKITIGLALPESFESDKLGAAPPGTVYKGLTGYFTLTEDDDVPFELSHWADVAYNSVATK